MIERVQITGFQSLRSIDLRFGRYTVIVGPSSSGKTALMRALRAVASNVRGTHVITRGQARMAVTVHTGEHQVILERDQTAGRYRIASGTRDETYTKLAGGVPADVTAALRIDPVPTNGTSVNFASQFDPPFLLGESGANVARTLGTLTNVTAILEAAREANRRRNAAAAELRTREDDLERVTAEARQYATLPARTQAVERAERLLEELETLLGRIGRVQVAVEALAVAERVLAQVPPPVVPDTRELDTALLRRTEGRCAIRNLALAEREAADTACRAEAAEQAVTEVGRELHALLREAGVCPVCNQPVTSRK